MKHAFLYGIVPFLIAASLIFGYAASGSGSMTSEQCVKTMGDLEKESAALSGQIRSCKQPASCQQLRIKLNRAIQRLSSLKRNCSTGMEKSSSTPAPKKAVRVPSGAGGVNQAGFKSGIVSGLNSSGDPLAASGSPSFSITPASGSTARADSGASGAANPEFNKLNCTFWIFGCSSMPDVSYADVNGELYVDGRGDASNIEANDVNQGGIGDCYYLASVAAISRQDPDYIKNMMRQNGNGTISVDFYRKKHWWEFWKSDYSRKTVTIDDAFPVDKNGNPVFAQFGDQASSGKLETWVMAMEKAYAQFRGSYNKISTGGWSADAMEQMTGRESLKFSASSVTLEQIADWDKNGYAITMSSKSSVPNKDVVGGHAYYLKGVDLTNKTITCGNPWGYNHVTLSLEEFRENYSYVAINPIH